MNLIIFSSAKCKHHKPCFSTPIGVLSLLLCAGAWSGPLCQAQPPKPGGGPAKKPQSDEAALQALHAQASELAKTNVEAAVALYGQFARDRPNLSPMRLAITYTGAARLRAAAKNLPGALSILDDGLRRLIGVPEARVIIVRTHAKVMAEAGKGEDAEAWLEPHLKEALEAAPEGWPDPARASGPREATALLNAYLDVLESQNKAPEFIAAAQQALLSVPGLLEDASIAAPSEKGGNKGSKKGNNGNNGKARGKMEPGLGSELYDRMIEMLQKTKRNDEALAWAKLRFRVCAFEKGSIDRAVASLRGAWISSGQLQKAGQFNTFLREAGKENPLSGIAPALLGSTLVEAQLRRIVPMDATQDTKDGEPEADDAPYNRVLGSKWGRQRQRISLLIVLGRFEEAAKVAQRILQSAPEETVGPEQIARVLKAKEDSLEPGNRFLEFLKTGEGENPLQSLLSK